MLLFSPLSVSQAAILLWERSERRNRSKQKIETFLFSADSCMCMWQACLPSGDSPFFTILHVRMGWGLKPVDVRLFFFFFTFSSSGLSQVPHCGSSFYQGKGLRRKLPPLTFRFSGSCGFAGNNPFRGLQKCLHRSFPVEGRELVPHICSQNKSYSFKEKTGG